MAASIRKGVILAGGKGTRLRPLTLLTNKHLLPVFDKPMVMYPLQTLKDAGVHDVCIVTGHDHVAQFVSFMGSGSKLGVSLTYRVQEEASGIADALLRSEDFFKGKKVIAILGDDIFNKISVPEKALEDDYAYVFISPVVNPHAVAVPELDKDDNIIRIEEKPKNPKSKFMVVGFYIYPNDVFDVIKTLKPSDRGELEITDVNNWYLNKKRLKAIKTSAFVVDAGTLESLLSASMWRAKQLGVKIGEL